jgi:hypothetical protein
LKTAAVLLAIALAIPAAAAPIARGGPLAVRVLFDNSGSMYPGYRPPGTPDRQKREQLGVGFIHQSPVFARWLDDFVQRQNVVDAGTVGMWTFTSNEQFTPADIQQVQAAVPVREFHAADALRRVPQQAGKNTYLTETLGTFCRGFTGLVWLITDNIVETNGGQPDLDV